jgi:hypothetical protein
MPLACFWVEKDLDVLAIPIRSSALDNEESPACRRPRSLRL